MAATGRRYTAEPIVIIRREDGLYRTGQPLGERLLRELQRHTAE